MSTKTLNLPGSTLTRSGRVVRAYDRNGRLISIRRFRSRWAAARYMSAPIPWHQVAIASAIGAIMGALFAIGV